MACHQSEMQLLTMMASTRSRRRRAAAIFLVGTWVVASARFMSHDQEWGIDIGSNDAFGQDLSSSTFLSSTPSGRDGVPNWDSALPASSGSFRSRKRRRGRLTFDLRGSSFSVSTVAPGTNAANETTLVSSQSEPTFMEQPDQVSLSTDPASAIHLIKLLAGFSVDFGAAFMGTLRLLAPLILARRALNACGDLGMDYMRGRYIRKTYTRLERMYMHYYELPAAFRATCRTLSQFVMMIVLSGMMGWMVGLHSPPCSVDGSCPRMWCAFLWILAVVGTGHFCASVLATWGGPLRIQVAASHMHTGQTMIARVFTRPWHILQWMQDPEQWISMMSTPQTMVQQPFEPNPILFPSTWVALRFCQMIAIAKAAASTGNWSPQHNPVRRIMWSLLVEIALADEWYRVFIVERRVGLAGFVSIAYLIGEYKCSHRRRYSHCYVYFLTTKLVLFAFSVYITGDHGSYNRFCSSHHAPTYSSRSQRFKLVECCNLLESPRSRTKRGYHQQLSNETTSCSTGTQV